MPKAKATGSVRQEAPQPGLSQRRHFLAAVSRHSANPLRRSQSAATPTPSTNTNGKPTHNAASNSQTHSTPIIQQNNVVSDSPRHSQTREQCYFTSPFIDYETIARKTYLLQTRACVCTRTNAIWRTAGQPGRPSLSTAHLLHS